MAETSVSSLAADADHGHLIPPPYVDVTAPRHFKNPRYASQCALGCETDTPGDAEKKRAVLSLLRREIAHLSLRLEAEQERKHGDNSIVQRAHELLCYAEGCYKYVYNHAFIYHALPSDTVYGGLRRIIRTCLELFVLAARSIGPALSSFETACESLQNYVLQPEAEVQIVDVANSHSRELKCLHRRFRPTRRTEKKVGPLSRMLKAYVAELSRILDDAGLDGLTPFHCYNCIIAGLDLDSAEARAGR